MQQTQVVYSLKHKNVIFPLEGDNWNIGIRKLARDQRVLLLLLTQNIGEDHKISFQITLPENTTHIVICTAGGSATQSGDTKREVIKTVVKAGNNNQGMYNMYGSLAEENAK